tara:strand:+ start:335 stop:529 length:195 start_codon:yes stop_codon:yes gene_type:complete
MDENDEKIILHKFNIISNDIKIMKDTIFDMKIELNEMRKILQELINYNNQKIEEPKKNYWFFSY